MSTECESATTMGWRYLWDRANVAVLKLSPDGTIRAANAYAQTLTGRPLSGSFVTDIVVDFEPAAASDRWWQPTEAPRLTNVETSSGLPQTLYVTVLELADGLLWLGQLDCEEQESLSAELISLNREMGELSRELELKNAELARLNVLKNQFLGMAAHDLRNPVHLVLGYAELLEGDSPSLAPEHRLYVEAITRSSQRMVGLIDSFLDVSLIDAGRFPLVLAPLDVARLLATATESVAPAALKRDITVAMHMEPGLVPVVADELKLLQVLINLLSNGVQHCSAGGVVKVGCRMQGEELFFWVQDQGTGMDAEEKERLFKAFSGSLARKSDGSRSIGLGLLIAQKIVTAHGGRMMVESEPGRGSTFGFTVPTHVPAES